MSDEVPNSTIVINTAENVMTMPYAEYKALKAKESRLIELAMEQVRFANQCEERMLKAEGQAAYYKVLQEQAMICLMDARKALRDSGYKGYIGPIS